jgi:ribosome-associated toxin RatA of RatAB toxin-antitoxin module
MSRSHAEAPLNRPSTGTSYGQEKMMTRLAHSALGCLLALSLSLSLSPVAHAEGAAPSAGSTKAAAKPSTAVATANVPGPTGGVDWGRAEGIIDARMSDVLAILHDYARYAGLFPHFEKSRVLSQRGGDAIVYLEAKVLHGAATLWGQVRMSSVAPTPGTHVVEAKMMKGKSNMSQFLARWEVQPVGDGQRTKVAFQLLVDPDLPFPDSVVSGEMKNSAGHAFRALRKRVSQRTTLATRSNTAM